MISERVGGIEDRKNIYYVHGAGNEGILHTAAGNTMSEKRINQSGGDFVTHDAAGFGIDITVEELLKMDPEVIVIGGVYNEKMEREFYESEALSQIRAVQDGEIYLKIMRLKLNLLKI